MSVMIFIIKSICPYCILSAITSTTIFIFSIYSLLKYKI
jgi:uncharacterized membrane protein